MYFQPAPSLVAASPRQGFVQRMAAAGRAIFELARQPPDLPETGAWQRKQLALWQVEQNVARHAKTPPPPLPPVLWGLSSGAPEKAMAAWRMEPMDDALWPTGCYQCAPEGTFRFVVISQLPRTRDTLLVRALSRGETFAKAMEDLDALPPDAPERLLVGPFLVSLHAQRHNPTDAEAADMMTQSQKIYEAFMQEQRAEAARGGRVESLRESILDVCEARELKLTAAQLAKIAAETRPATLRRWHIRAATAERAAEIFAAAK